MKNDHIQHIPLEKIERNPNQPRETFPDEHIARLADSIRTRGLIQPITVRPNGDRFQIVAGECRYRAHVLLAVVSTYPANALSPALFKLAKVELSVWPVDF